MVDLKKNNRNEDSNGVANPVGRGGLRVLGMLAVMFVAFFSSQEIISHVLSSNQTAKLDTSDVIYLNLGITFIYSFITTLTLTVLSNPIKKNQYLLDVLLPNKYSTFIRKLKFIDILIIFWLAYLTLPIVRKIF